MPKKTRKAKIRAAQRPLNVSPVPTVSSVTEPTRTAITAAPIANRTVAMPTFDYSYVSRDLRRIGLLALFFFLVMFALWFVVEVQGIHIIPGVL